MIEEIKSKRRIQENATNIAALLLETDFPKPTNLPVKIRLKSGEIIDGDFAGYWDLRQLGMDYVPCIGYRDKSGYYSHGRLSPGDELLTPIPTVDEWVPHSNKNVKKPE